MIIVTMQIGNKIDSSLYKFSFLHSFLFLSSWREGKFPKIRHLEHFRESNIMNFCKNLSCFRYLVISFFCIKSRLIAYINFSFYLLPFYCILYCKTVSGKSNPKRMKRMFEKTKKLCGASPHFYLAQCLSLYFGGSADPSPDIIMYN